MILDKVLLSKLDIIGKGFLERVGINKYPGNIDDMYKFLLEMKKSIETNEFEGVLIGDILFSFVSNEEIRDRKSTSRTFEDIFSSLFGQESSDIIVRSNPISTDEIIQLDTLCKNEDWKISADLSSNKREKADLILGNYSISLKTLKGPIIGENGEVIDNRINDELNVGSLSYRALLKGILTDEQIAVLGDRKSGLGSGTQLRANIFDPINESAKNDIFLERLNMYLSYVYEEDIYIILKSHYHIYFILIPNQSFINSLTFSYKNAEHEFEKIFYRWENNNLRLRWRNMLFAMDKYQLPYYKLNINLENCFSNRKLIKFKNEIESHIESFIKDNAR